MIWTQLSLALTSRPALLTSQGCGNPCGHGQGQGKGDGDTARGRSSSFWDRDSPVAPHSALCSHTESQDEQKSKECNLLKIIVEGVSPIGFLRFISSSEIRGNHGTPPTQPDF